MNRALMFYQTPIGSCPYWPENLERNVVADPEWPMSREMYRTLIQHGFRRSGDTVYRPNCPNCGECVAVRIDLSQFSPNRTQRRNLKSNADLDVTVCQGHFSDTHFRLYCHYLEERHADSSMANPSPEAFSRFLLCQWSDVVFLEARLQQQLIGVMVCDRVGEDLSAVYSFYHPDFIRRGLGKFLVLAAIQQVMNVWQGQYVYLGYWLDQHPKMAYKNDYSGLEYFDGQDWSQHPPAK